MKRKFYLWSSGKRVLKVTIWGTKLFNLHLIGDASMFSVPDLFRVYCPLDQRLKTGSPLGCARPAYMFCLTLWYFVLSWSPAWREWDCLSVDIALACVLWKVIDTIWKRKIFEEVAEVECWCWPWAIFHRSRNKARHSLLKTSLPESSTRAPCITTACTLSCQCLSSLLSLWGKEMWLWSLATLWSISPSWQKALVCSITFSVSFLSALIASLLVGSFRQEHTLSSSLSKRIISYCLFDTLAQSQLLFITSLALFLKILGQLSLLPA